MLTVWIFVVNISVFYHFFKNYAPIRNLVKVVCVVVRLHVQHYMEGSNLDGGVPQLAVVGLGLDCYILDECGAQKSHFRIRPVSLHFHN